MSLKAEKWRLINYTARKKSGERSHDAPPSQWSQVASCSYGNTDHTLTMVQIKAMMTSLSMEEKGSVAPTNVYQSSTQRCTEKL